MKKFYVVVQESDPRPKLDEHFWMDFHTNKKMATREAKLRNQFAKQNGYFDDDYIVLTFKKE